MDYTNQSFLVMGISRSGIAAAEFLLARGAKVFLYDDVSEGAVAENVERLGKMGASRLSADSPEQAASRIDVLVLSPGVPIDNRYPVAFRKAKKRIVGEMQLAFSVVRARTVAVTGTNGKTTTVGMITDILNAANLPATACGNVGTPMLPLAEQSDFSHTLVAEVSSFQLETLADHKPHIAVVTNITEDHLNRHYNMNNYIFLKRKLLANLKESEYAVLNADDPVVSSFAEGLRAKVVFFSSRRQTDGAYLAGNCLYYMGELVTDVQSLALGGKHNIENALAAICVAKILGVESEVIAAALAKFKGARHRIETVATVGGVTYIDDSKGTNVDATLKAVESMTEPTILLVGGKDKGYDYTLLFTKLFASNVVHAVLYGENAYKLLQCAAQAKYRQLTLCSDFTTAVRIASLLAKPGQTVLLSPASASFDAFSNYEERGDKFRELVLSLKAERGEGEQGEENSTPLADTGAEHLQYADLQNAAQSIATQNAAAQSAFTQNAFTQSAGARNAGLQYAGLQNAAVQSNYAGVSLPNGKGQEE